MQYAIHASNMQEFDAKASQLIPEIILMENAGRTIAEEIYNDCIRRGLYKGTLPIVVFLIGKGHNGGDGLVAARHLLNKGFEVQVFICKGDLKPLCIRMQNCIDQAQIRTLDKLGCKNLLKLLSIDPPRNTKNLGTSSNKEIAFLPQYIFVDALFGAGLDRPLVAESAPLPNCEQLVEAWKESNSIRFAVDIPSGSGDFTSLQQDSGQNNNNAQHFKQGLVFKADITLAIQFPRTFLYGEPLRSLAGDIRILEIGFPRKLVQEYQKKPKKYGLLPIIEIADIHTFFPQISQSSHKGSRGKIDVYAGSEGSLGAALLSARSAMHSAAGMVRLACTSPELTAIVLEQEPAIMTIPSLPRTSPTTPAKIENNSNDNWADCILVGPGWGRNNEMLLTNILAYDLPMVIDAEGLPALRLLFEKTKGKFKIPKSKSSKSKKGGYRESLIVLTPHPGEAATLLACPLSDVTRSPIESAQKIARQYQSIVVLKSSVSVIATPAGECFMYDGRNPALGTAGSGDLLAGIISALLARSLNMESQSKNNTPVMLGLYSCIAGVLLHSYAGLRCFRSKGWFTANQMLTCIAQVAAELHYEVCEKVLSH